MSYKPLMCFLVVIKRKNSKLNEIRKMDEDIEGDFEQLENEVIYYKKQEDST